MTAFRLAELALGQPGEVYPDLMSPPTGAPTSVRLHVVVIFALATTVMVLVAIGIQMTAAAPENKREQNAQPQNPPSLP